MKEIEGVKYFSEVEIEDAFVHAGADFLHSMCEHTDDAESGVMALISTSIVRNYFYQNLKHEDKEEDEE